jgi:dihydrofolate reductase
MGRLVLVAAVGKGGVIGVNNELPWHLPEDLRRFKALTTGHTVAMGRKTYDSIIARLGKPLPNRQSVVLTRDAHWMPQPDHCATVRVVRGVDGLLVLQDDPIYVIGGAEIYRLTLSIASELDITEVDLDVAGDAFFPDIDAAQWSRQAGENLTSESSAIDYRFVRYQRIPT